MCFSPPNFFFLVFYFFLMEREPRVVRKIEVQGWCALYLSPEGVLCGETADGEADVSLSTQGTLLVRCLPRRLGTEKTGSKGSSSNKDSSKGSSSILHTLTICSRRKDSGFAATSGSATPSGPANPSGSATKTTKFPFYHELQPPCQFALEKIHLNQGSELQVEGDMLGGSELTFICRDSTLYIPEVRCRYLRLKALSSSRISIPKLRASTVVLTSNLGSTVKLPAAKIDMLLRVTTGNSSTATVSSSHCPHKTVLVVFRDAVCSAPPGTLKTRVKMNVGARASLSAGHTQDLKVRTRMESHAKVESSAGVAVLDASAFSSIRGTRVTKDGSACSSSGSTIAYKGVKLREKEEGGAICREGCYF